MVVGWFMKIHRKPVENDVKGCGNFVFFDDFLIILINVPVYIRETNVFLIIFFR